MLLHPRRLKVSWRRGTPRQRISAESLPPNSALSPGLWGAPPRSANHLGTNEMEGLFEHNFWCVHLLCVSTFGRLVWEDFVAFLDPHIGGASGHRGLWTVGARMGVGVELRRAVVFL